MSFIGWILITNKYVVLIFCNKQPNLQQYQLCPGNQTIHVSLNLTILINSIYLFPLFLLILSRKLGSFREQQLNTSQSVLCVRKNQNCRLNPYCIYRLGLEKFDKRLASQKDDASNSNSEPLIRRNPNLQPCGLVNYGNFVMLTAFYSSVFGFLTGITLFFGFQ
ncbi:hypothetical protein Mgra_00007619 [Meloidogyne graminicola]|uniref:Transmembrane protein n=1 Tax=Meloidogyne graminicola TaxID=189291 RepID=A0A8S9ZIC7_9BILA|nr:hypothetical protein Mgra_00007619 [Meloidogyne graminicola]